MQDFLRGSGHEDDVIADHRKAHELGARGVPFFVIDGRYGVSGAQSVEVFSDALARARRASSPITRNATFCSMPPAVGQLPAQAWFS